MDDGRVRVPCHDELQLVGTDKFLLTLVGHSCYSLAVAAPQPLEVYLYDNVGFEARPQRPSNDSALVLKDVPLDVDPHVCRGTPTCYQVREGLSPSTVYSLVIARSRGEDGALDEAEQVNVLLDLQHCDPLSASHYLGRTLTLQSIHVIDRQLTSLMCVAGLLMVGALGFTSVLLLLCLVGEFVLGFRSVSKLRKSVDSIRFVELTQLEAMTKVTVVDGDEEAVLVDDKETEGEPVVSICDGREEELDNAGMEEDQPLTMSA
jgi:hypothetical protein